MLTFVVTLTREDRQAASPDRWNKYGLFFSSSAHGHIFSSCSVFFSSRIGAKYFTIGWELKYTITKHKFRYNHKACSTSRDLKLHKAYIWCSPMVSLIVYYETEFTIENSVAPPLILLFEDRELLVFYLGVYSGLKYVIWSWLWFC